MLLQDEDSANVNDRIMRQATGSAIRLRAMIKRFGSLTAVDGLDLDVPFGTCVGLLGPNGAGKSTTMKALTAQVIADEGEIEVLGHRLPGDSKQARAEMGVVPQLDNLDVSLTVEQNLLVFAHLYRVAAGSRKGSAAACGAGCSSHARCCTSRGSCCSTSRPSAWIRRCARSCGR
jgi:lipooligosaccharide transport system ATP-binding protein